MISAHPNNHDDENYHRSNNHDDEHDHYYFNSSQQQEPSQTQMTTEILTQNADWTQMGDDDEDDEMIDKGMASSSSMLLERQSLLVVLPPPPPQPWGRLMPCSSTGQITQFFPRSPTGSGSSSRYTDGGGGGGSRPGVAVQPLQHPTAFLRHVKPGDIFNVHSIGRSTKCDIQAKNPSVLCRSSNRICSSNSNSQSHNHIGTTRSTTMDKKICARQEWCYGMISNRHCKIYCTVDALALANAGIHVQHDSDEDIANKLLSSSAGCIQVWVEDCSGNGTVINGTTLLLKGDKRLLHSGDEICLVQKQTLQKKVVSRTELQNLLNEYSFVFVNCFNNTTSTTNHETDDIVIANSGNSGGSRTKRKAAVDVRATKSTRNRHSIDSLPENPPTLFESGGKGMLSSTTNGHDRKRLRSSLSSDVGDDDWATTSSQPPFPTTVRPPLPNRRISPRRQPPRRVNEDYDIRDVLGSGTMGEVRRAIHRRTGEAVAIKVIPIKRRSTKPHHNNPSMSSCTTSATMEIEMEASILRKLQHPYIVKLMDVYTGPTAVYLVMELVQGGDLFDRIIQRGQYTEIDTRRVMRRLFAAIHYLHESSGYGIVHRDLKPENILLTSTSSDIDVKLTDFGLAKQDGDLKTFCGTPQYFAPEVLRRRHTVKGNGRYGKQADMWSLGVILYVLLTGTPPFDVEDSHNNPHAMTAPLSQSNGDGDPIQLDFPSNISLAAQDMVRQLLQYDPRKRASILSACTHEWILQDDGDTHIHPLDDPMLQRNGMTQPKNMTSTSIIHTTMTTQPTHDDKPNAASLENSFALASPPSHDTSPVIPSTETTKMITTTSAENFSFKKDLSCSIDSAHRTPIIQNLEDKQRKPLLPVVVVAKTSVFLPPKHVPTTLPNFQLYSVPTNHVTPTTALNTVSTTIVPSTAMSTDGKLQLLSTNQPLTSDNNNDEIMSRFSENTDSVGSFSTANTYEMVLNVTETTDKSRSRKHGPTGEDQRNTKSLLSKKKRSLSNISPSVSKLMLSSGKTVKQSNRNNKKNSSWTTIRTSSTEKTKKKTRFRTASPSTSVAQRNNQKQQPIPSNEMTAAAIVMNVKKTVLTTASTTTATTNSGGGDGRKQLTLNNWFKKQN